MDPTIATLQTQVQQLQTTMIQMQQMLTNQAPPHFKHQNKFNYGGRNGGHGRGRGRGRNYGHDCGRVWGQPPDSNYNPFVQHNSNPFLQQNQNPFQQQQQQPRFFSHYYFTHRICGHTSNMQKPRV